MTLRGYVIELADNIINMCPEGRERSLAITALEESLMWAVKSIGLGDAVVELDWQKEQQ